MRQDSRKVTPLELNEQAGFASIEPLEPRLLMSVDFASAVNYGTGDRPFSVTSADFNGDGKPDLAVANNSTIYAGTVSVFLNKGNGTFAAKVDYATGSNPWSVISADFNGDGKADLAVSNCSADTVSVLMGKGDGTFATKVDYSTGGQPYSVTTGDFNGDGHPDLATANRASNSMSVLLNNGNGTFAANVDYIVGVSSNAITSADFNADGKSDLAVTNEDGGTVSVRLAKSDGSGAFPTQTNYAVGISPSSVTTTDFNADGKPDLVVAGWSGNIVSVLRNLGAGTFAAKVDYATGSGPASVISADFDGNGKPDLATANSYNTTTVSVLLHNGRYNTFLPKTDFTVGIDAESVTSADFNGDGKPDMAVTNGTDNTVSVLLNRSGYFAISGTTLTVTGTAGADSFAFVPGTPTCEVTVNGFSRGFDNSAATAIILDGAGGNDTAKITGSGAAETAKMYPGHATFTGGAQSVSTANMENLTVVGGAADAGYLYDSAGDDTLIAKPTYATLSGAGFSNTVKTFPNVYAHATLGGTDIAKLYDSAGNDTFTAYPTYATLVGTGFHNYAGGFDKAYGYATAGGTDTAKLYDSAGNDAFTGTSTYGVMSGTGFYNYAGSFDKVYAYATAGGTDKASLNGTGGNDQFYGRTDYGQLTAYPAAGSAYFLYVQAFDTVTVSSSAGSDGYDTSGLLYTAKFLATGHWIARAS